MPAFDEMLALEETLDEVERQLVWTQDYVRERSIHVMEVKKEISMIEIHLSTLAEHYRFLKQAQVVLLSEWDQVVRLTEHNKALLAAKKMDLITSEKQGRDAQNSIRRLEAQHRDTTKKLGAYQQVVQFR